jgi:Ca-activated chloride channel family protein
MTVQKAVLVVMAATLIGDGEPGWLAKALARTDPDIDAAVAAYEAEDMDLALQHLDAATERRGQRPEIEYDRGLALLATGDKEAAREAFQRGTESDVWGVLASSHYELGNLSMMDEDWETAITQYIACLRAQPDHQNAKWNLELALQRKREQEKKEQEEKEKNDQQNQDQQNQDQQNQDQQNQDQQNQDQQNQDQQNQDQQNQDQQNQDQQNQGQDQQKQDQQQQPPAEPKEQPAQAKPIESGDLDAALEQLDRQDQFLLGRPRGSRRPVEKDW